MKPLVLSALLLLSPALAAGQSPFDGTWRVDLDKVKFPEKPEQIVVRDGRYSCSTCVPEIDVKADGSDQQVGAPYFDTIAVKVVDDKTLQTTYKKDGKVVQEVRTTLGANSNEFVNTFTFYPPQGDPVKGTGRGVRVEKAPEGAHALSGSWRLQRLDQLSENALVWTFQSTPEGLTMKSKTGESYDAKFDGKDYPIKGDRAGTTVALKRVDDRTLEETLKRDGKVVATSRSTVSADGKTLNVTYEDKERGTTQQFAATKQ
jgi:hypothetical protein